MTRRAGVVALLCAGLVGVSGPRVATAQEQRATLSRAVVELRVPDVLSISSPAFRRGDEILLPLSPLMDSLGVAVRTTRRGPQFRSPRGGEVLVDTVAGVVRDGSQRIVFSRGDVLVADDGVYVLGSLLGRLLGVRIVVDWGAGRVTIFDGERLLAVRRSPAAGARAPRDDTLAAPVPGVGIVPHGDRADGVVVLGPRLIPLPLPPTPAQPPVKRPPVVPPPVLPAPAVVPSALFRGDDTVLVLRAVTFQGGSAVLSPQSYAILDAIAQQLRAAPTLYVEVGAHTDAQGSATANVALSKARAAVVRYYLVRLGVPAARLTARGYGASVPVASNATAEGRAENRRVVLTRQAPR